MSAVRDRGRLPEARSAQRRVVVLGASNLARGIAALVEAARRQFGPVELVAAIGHGRSFGQTSSVLGRALPGILQCGLWADLERPRPYGTSALVTDVGNDLLYGMAPAQVATWVAECLERLGRLSDELTLCGLPLANVAGLSRARYLAFRTLFVPSCRLSLEVVAARAAELQARLRELAAERGARWLEPAADWYGHDPIHWRRPARKEIFPRLLGSSEGSSGSCDSSSAARRELYLRTLAPHERRLWGIVQRRAQPAGRLSDGTTIALY